MAIFSEARRKENKSWTHSSVVVATAGVNYHQSFGIALRSNNAGEELEENFSDLRILWGWWPGHLKLISDDWNVYLRHWNGWDAWCFGKLVTLVIGDWGLVYGVARDHFLIVLQGQLPGPSEVGLVGEYLYSLSDSCCCLQSRLRRRHKRDLF